MLSLPVQRQLLEMELNGLDNISPSTILGGFKYLKEKYFDPLFEAMLIELRKGIHWHVEETSWYVFIEIHDKKGFRWYLWVFISENIVFYKVAPTRSAKVSLDVLFNINLKDIKKYQKRHRRKKY